MMQAVVLASGSRYRAELLSRLAVPFTTLSPDIDESPQRAEKPAPLSARLAQQKALAAQISLRTNRTQNGSQNSAQTTSGATPTEPIIIASDQVAYGAGKIMGKPGSIAAACAQLEAISERKVVFYTALHMINSANGEQFTALDTTTVQVRKLSQSAIQRYVEKDQPLDCAGSFKVESLGISLFSGIDCHDPTGLVGLPLISVCEGLRRFGIALP